MLFIKWGIKMNKQISRIYLFVIATILLKTTTMHGPVKAIQRTVESSVSLSMAVDSKICSLELRKDSTEAYLFYLRATKTTGNPPFLFGLKGTFSFAGSSVTMDTLKTLSSQQTIFGIAYGATDIMTLNNLSVTPNASLVTLTCNGLDILNDNSTMPTIYTFSNGNTIKSGDSFTATNSDPNDKTKKGTFQMTGTIQLTTSPLILSPEDNPSVISGKDATGNLDGTLKIYNNNNDHNLGTLTITSCTLLSKAGDLSYTFPSNVIKSGDIAKDATNQPKIVTVLNATNSLVLTNNHYIDYNAQSTPTIYDSTITTSGKPVDIATLTTPPTPTTP